MRFSQRLGITPPAKLVQRETLDEDLRNGLWSLLTILYWDLYQLGTSPNRYDDNYVRESNLGPLIVPLWLHFFKKPVDAIPKYWSDCQAVLRKSFFNAPWYEVYDFVEFVAAHGPQSRRKDFIDLCNSFLERENSAYRFVNGSIVEIASKEEISEVESAIESAAPYAGVRIHLQTALTLMTDKQNPDVRNSIKESISAIESLAKQIAGDDKATLGTVLKRLEQSKDLHPALKNAFSSLYGYTSDAEGIRHSLLDESNLTKTDARFMLVCCSAFVNYCIAMLAS